MVAGKVKSDLRFQSLVFKRFIIGENVSYGAVFESKRISPKDVPKYFKILTPIFQKANKINTMPQRNIDHIIVSTAVFYDGFYLFVS